MMRAATGLLILVSFASAADVANMSGVWKLNLEESQFDGDNAPLNAQITIQHEEPSFKYSGTVHRTQASSPDMYEFEGAIDEKIYPVKENNKTGRTIKFKRKSSNSVESWSSDAAMEEYAVTTITSDGNKLVRKMTVKLKDGGKTARWSEVYNKQQ